jgi:hypothetical protein
MAPSKSASISTPCGQSGRSRVGWGGGAATSKRGRRAGARSSRGRQEVRGVLLWRCACCCLHAQRTLARVTVETTAGASPEQHILFTLNHLLTTPGPPPPPTHTRGPYRVPPTPPPTGCPPPHPHPTPPHPPHPTLASGSSPDSGGCCCSSSASRCLAPSSWSSSCSCSLMSLAPLVSPSPRPVPPACRTGTGGKRGYGPQGRGRAMKTKGSRPQSRSPVARPAHAPASFHSPWPPSPPSPPSPAGMQKPSCAREPTHKHTF